MDGIGDLNGDGVLESEDIHNDAGDGSDCLCKNRHHDSEINFPGFCDSEDHLKNEPDTVKELENQSVIACANLVEVILRLLGDHLCSDTWNPANDIKVYDGHHRNCDVAGNEF